jgi:hypothetical protein
MNALGYTTAGVVETDVAMRSIFYRIHRRALGLAAAALLLFGCADHGGPDAYQGWIDHLVGRDSIVIFHDGRSEASASSNDARARSPACGRRWENSAGRAMSGPSSTPSCWSATPSAPSWTGGP